MLKRCTGYLKLVECVFHEQWNDLHLYSKHQESLRCVKNIEDKCRMTFEELYINDRFKSMLLK